MRKKKSIQILDKRILQVSLRAKQPEPDRVGYILPSGGHASFIGIPDQDTIRAVNAMIELASRTVLSQRR